MDALRDWISKLTAPAPLTAEQAAQAAEGRVDGLHPAAADEEGNTPLHLAARADAADACAALLERDPEAAARRNLAQATALHAAAKAGAEHALAALLPASDAGAVDENGCTALHLAAFDNRERAVELLIPATDLDARSSQSSLTALHVAAAKGFAGVMGRLLAAGADADAADEGGNTPLHMAACNGFEWAVGVLLPAAAASQAKRTARLATPLYLASRNGHSRVVRALLDALATMGGDTDEEVIAMRDVSGYSALHAACLGGHVEAAQDLIDAGADVDAAARDGSTPLLCCRSSAAAPIARLLLEGGADSSAVTVFGSTVLHHACSAGAYDLVDAVLDSSDAAALMAAQDNDGMMAVHSLAQAAVKDGRFAPTRGPWYTTQYLNPDDEQPNGNIQVIFQRLCGVAGGDVGALDYGDSSALHFLAFGPHTATSLWLARALLDAGVDPTLENCQGWTPLHACGDQTSAFAELMRGAVGEEWLASFDADKPRNVDNETYLKRRGAHNRIPEQDRAGVLRGDYSGAGVCAHLRRLGRTPKIVVMAGAGISTSCGIPDFRSEGSGIFMNKTYADAFNIEDPVKFYRCVHDLFLPCHDGAVQPSPTHRWLKELQDRGALLRLYTQNIDGLEFAAGLERERVVEAHGTFRTARCMGCAAEVAEEDMEEAFWAAIRADAGVPMCRRCDGGVLRPNVVFFGEGVDSRFNELRDDDLAQCDALVVLGTSLVVYPFAGLTQQVPPLAPRVLVNRKPTGCFQHLDRARDDPDEALASSYRDVFIGGDCDAGVEGLVFWDD